MVTKNNLEDVLRKERPRAYAYCDMNKPFTYLDEVNKEYFMCLFPKDKVYDFALDAYNYWKKNGVLNAKHESLVTTFKMMYKQFERYMINEE
jgi:hypothetical protein